MYKYMYTDRIVWELVDFVTNHYLIALSRYLSPRICLFSIAFTLIPTISFGSQSASNAGRFA